MKDNICQIRYYLLFTTSFGFPFEESVDQFQSPHRDLNRFELFVKAKKSCVYGSIIIKRIDFVICVALEIIATPTSFYICTFSVRVYLSLLIGL